MYLWPLLFTELNAFFVNSKEHLLKGNSKKFLQHFIACMWEDFKAV